MPINSPRLLVSSIMRPAAATSGFLELLHRGVDLQRRPGNDRAHLRPLHPFFPNRFTSRGPTWNEHRSSWVAPSWLPPPRKSFLVPPSAFPVAEAPQPATRLVFPVFRPGARLELRPLSPAESLARCLQNLRGEPQVTPQAAATLRRLVAQAPAAELRHSSASMAAQALKEWVL